MIVNLLKLIKIAFIFVFISLAFLGYLYAGVVYGGNGEDGGYADESRVVPTTADGFIPDFSSDEQEYFEDARLPKYQRPNDRGIPEGPLLAEDLDTPFFPDDAYSEKGIFDLSEQRFTADEQTVMAERLIAGVTPACPNDQVEASVDEDGNFTISVIPAVGDITLPNADKVAIQKLNEGFKGLTPEQRKEYVKENADRYKDFGAITIYPGGGGEILVDELPASDTKVNYYQYGEYDASHSFTGPLRGIYGKLTEGLPNATVDVKDVKQYTYNGANGGTVVENAPGVFSTAEHVVRGLKSGDKIIIDGQQREIDKIVHGHHFGEQRWAPKDEGTTVFTITQSPGANKLEVGDALPIIPILQSAPPEAGDEVYFYSRKTDVMNIPVVNPMGLSDKDLGDIKGRVLADEKKFNGIVNEYMINHSGPDRKNIPDLTWEEVSEKLIKNGWAEAISQEERLKKGEQDDPPAVRLKKGVDFAAAKEHIAEAFGNHFPVIWPMLQNSEDGNTFPTDIPIVGGQSGSGLYKKDYSGKAILIGNTSHFGNASGDRIQTNSFFTVPGTDKALDRLTQEYGVENIKD